MKNDDWFEVNPIEDLKFPDIFDGLYFGACIGALLIIVSTISVLILFLLTGIDYMQNVLISIIFLENIIFFTFLKHNKIINASVWEEINKPKQGGGDKFGLQAGIKPKIVSKEWFA